VPYLLKGPLLVPVVHYGGRDLLRDPVYALQFENIGLINVNESVALDRQSRICTSQTVKALGPRGGAAQVPPGRHADFRPQLLQLVGPDPPDQGQVLHFPEPADSWRSPC
jgi:hypothetical protein